MTRFRSLKIAAALLVAAAAQAPAQVPKSQLDIGQELAVARLDFRADSGGYKGEGWKRLLSDADQAQFFVVGEQHGGKEIIAFESALQAALAPRGYNHVAMEIGRYSAIKAERLMRSGPTTFDDYLMPKEHGWIYPFVGWRDELELAKQYVRLSRARNTIWGLDQEFVGSIPILIEVLEPRARSASQQAALAQLKAASAADPKWLTNMKEEDWAPLAVAFAGDPKAIDAIRTFQLSNRIYAPFVTGKGNTYDSNLIRENLMKRNFAAAFAEAERQEHRPPKVFMKIGADHAQRGFSKTNVPALTDFISQWGIPRGFSTVNVMVDCVSSGPDGPCSPYFGSDHAIYAAASPDKYTLFDLRPLRAHLGATKNLDAKSRDLILSFDYYLLIRDVSAPTSLRHPKPAAAGQGTGNTK